ncbi:MAG TPA: CAAD domain-containing protein [Chroococcidiopsis sp.]
MEPEVKQDNSSDFGAEEINVDLGASSTTPSVDSNEQLLEAAQKVSKFLSDLPDYLPTFFGEYRRPIVTIGLIVVSIIAVKLTLAVLDSVNDIPLLAPSFELIGLGYTTWFVYRYLWRASNRKELLDDFGTLRDEILGGSSSPKD